MTDTTIADPFAETAAPATTDEEFAEPITEYVSLEDLDGRLVIVFPKKVTEGTSKNNGEKYDIAVSDVVIVDGPLTDKITELPMVVSDMHLSAKGVFSRIRAYAGQDKPVLGRIDSKPSSFNKRVLAYALLTPTDEDKVKARPALAAYRAAQYAG